MTLSNPPTHSPNPGDRSVSPTYEASTTVTNPSSSNSYRSGPSIGYKATGLTTRRADKAGQV